MYGGTLQKLKNSFSPLIILAKSFIIEVWLGPKYASDMDDERFKTAKSKSNSTRSHIFRVHIYSKRLISTKFSVLPQLQPKNWWGSFFTVELTSKYTKWQQRDSNPQPLGS